MVLDDLLSKKRYQDAAQVFLDYSKNVRQCILALAQGNLFSEARRVVCIVFVFIHCISTYKTMTQITLHRVPSLLEEIIYSATLDTRTQVAEDLDEMRAQLQKQVERLRELRIKKEEEPGNVYFYTQLSLHCSRTRLCQTPSMLLKTTQHYMAWML